MLVLGPIVSHGYDFKLSSRQINCPFDRLVEAELQPLRQQKSWSVYQLFIFFFVFEDASVSQSHKAVTACLCPVFQRPLPEMKQNTIRAWTTYTGVVGFGTNNVFFCKPSGGCRVSHAIKVIYLLKKQLQF